MSDKNMNAFDYTQMCIKKYGVKTIENRAIPDYRDGMLPVQRRLMYCAHRLGTAKHKSARLIGDTLGTAHPHGDIALYGAMVRLVQSGTPLLKGYGNWGSYLDPKSFAAHRYTEYQISDFAKQVLLTSDNMSVLDYIANFDGTTVEPIILNTNIPLLLINGMLGGIAVGTTTNIPAYTPKSVAYITAKYLKTGKVSVADCMKLDFNFSWGGTVSDTSLAELKEFYETGSAKVGFISNYEVRGNLVIIKSIPPHLDAEKAIEKAQDFSVGSKQLIIGGARDLSDENGIHIEFTLASKISAATDAKTFVEKVFRSSIGLRCNVTKRNMTEEALTGGADVLDTEFSSTTIIGVIKDWSEYRKGLEKKIRKQKVLALQKENHQLNLMIIARKNIDVIKDSLEHEGEDLYQYLLDNIECNIELTLDDVKYIMSRQIIALSKTDIAKTRNKIKENKATIAEHKEVYKNPTDYLISLLKGIK
jgi:DNA gyrase/topoisomerase IV subunit A